MSTGRTKSKGYKQTEMGFIPDDWDVKKLGDIGDCLIGLTYSPSDVDTHGVLVLRSSNIQNDHLAFEDNVYVNSDIPERLRVRPDDILICVRNGSRGLIGKCVLLDMRVKGETFGAFMSVYRTAYPRYVFQQFRSNNIQSQIHMHLGATINQITNKSLKSFKIPFPLDNEERSNIADALFDADSLIESLQKLLTKKRVIKQGAMQGLLSGRHRLPGFEKKWEVKRIGEFTDCVAGGTPSTLIPEYWNGEIRWMSSGELHKKFVYEVEGRITKIGLQNSSTNPIPKNCVLVGLAGQGKTRGTVAVNKVELCTNQSIAAIFPAESYVTEYLYYNLDNRYDELRGLSTGGTGRGGLNLSIIKAITLPFPEKNEQAAIAEILFEMDSEIDSLVQKLKKYRQLKQGMMQVLLTGKIRLPIT